jgi:hypothetical protein
MFSATQVRMPRSDIPHSPYHAQNGFSAVTKTQHSANKKPHTASGRFMLQVFLANFIDLEIYIEK